MEQAQLAIDGGAKAKQTPYGREQRYGAEEMEQLQEALEQGTLFYAQGKKVRQLEAEFAEKSGVPYAVCCTSGTAAIHSALMAVGISPGEEVITSPITDMGTLSPILYQGAIPIFADLHPHTYTLIPESVEACITPRTKAVIAVNLAGNACDLDALREICNRRNLYLIEDCAQTFGCRYKGRPIGTTGDIGCFSFNEYKHISCGDGGITVTRDAALAERLRLSTDKAYSRRADAPERRPTFLANNYRMTELQGAVALAQFRKLDSIVSRRQAWCGELSRRLEGVRGITLPGIAEGVEPSWWFYMMRVDEAQMGVSTDVVAKALQAEGLPIGAHYIGKCVYEHPLFTNKSAFARAPHACDSYDYRAGMCPNAEAILNTCIALSVNEAYTLNDLDETVEGIRKVAEGLEK